MAEGVIIPAAFEAAKPIGNWATKKVDLLYHESDAAKVLRQLLKEMKSLLEDPDREQSKREWLCMADMIDLEYRAEDAIEEHEVHLRPRTKRASQIQDLTSKIEDVINKMKGEGNDGAGQSSAASDSSRITTPVIKKGDYFVGREKELDQLISLLGEGNKQPIISVFGMPGIGKTTISRITYNCVENFEASAWVCITQQCQIRSVLDDVLRQLTLFGADEISLMSEETVDNELLKVQREKRCLIVVDDIWQVDHWDQLKDAFNAIDFKTKILLTTRKRKVANIAHEDSRIELKHLEEDFAWELLKKKIFTDGKIPDDFSLKGHDHVCKIGREMAKKCAGLPLSICLLSGVFMAQNTMEKWELVNEDMDKYLCEAGKDKELEAIVKLSYDELPYHLKLCFFYLAILREDESMPVGVLYRMWIAQSMISDENRRRLKASSLMDTAQTYLNDLASRSIVQVEDDYGVPAKKFKTCKLHDAVLKVCRSIGIKVKNGVEIAEYTTGRFSNLLKNHVNSDIRHLVIYCKKEFASDDEFKLEKGDEENCKRLRSLHIYNDTEGKTRIEFPRKVDFQKFRSLRSLVFERFKFVGKESLETATALDHLKYLCFRSCEIEKGLPRSMKKLVFLDTLDLFKSPYIRIPNDLKNMPPRLKHLLLPSYDGIKSEGQKKLKLAGGLDQLESLMEVNTSVHEFSDGTGMEKLQRFSAHVHDEKSLSTILTTVIEKGNELVNCSVTVKGISKITSKEVKEVFSCRNLHNLEIHVPLRNLLTQCWGDITGSKLVYLVLLNCEIEEDPMGILGELPSLAELTFNRRSYVGQQMTCGGSSFPRLRKLKIFSLPGLGKWILDEGAMPLISEMHICGCPALKVPDGLRYISTLTKLELCKMMGNWRKVLATDSNLRHIRPCITPNANYSLFGRSTQIPGVWR